MLVRASIPERSCETMSRLNIELPGLHLKNPIMPASGCLVSVGICRAI